MNIGERVECDHKGNVTGKDTGRLIAKFSHIQEAESFVELINGVPYDKWKDLAIIGFTIGEWTQEHKDACDEFRELYYK